MKTLLLLSMIAFGSMAFADWSYEKPITATLVSFDQKCAKFKESTGETVNLDISVLKGLKRQPQATKIEYFKKTRDQNICQMN